MALRSRSFKRILLTMKHGLAGKQAREAYVFLFFVAVATAFWVIQALQETYETEVAVPIELTDVPEGVVITRPITDTVYARVRERGMTLLSLYFKTQEEQLRMSFKNFDTHRQVGSVVVTNVQKRLAASVANNLTILSVRPDTVSFAYNRGVCCKMPVRVLGGVTTAAQYYIQKMTLSPDSVMVYAPRNVLDTLQAAYFEVDSCGALSRDSHITARRCVTGDVCYVPDTVVANVAVDMYTEKTVRVPVVGVNFPAGKHLRAFPSTVSVTFSVGTKLYNNIKSEDFVLAVPYEELMDRPSDTWHVHFRSLPPGVANPRFSPTEVEYLIEQMASGE